MWYFIVLAAIEIIGCHLIPAFSFSSPALRHAKSDTQSDTQAIPLLQRYGRGSTLSPKGFPQVFVCAVISTASRPHVACIPQEPTIWTGNHELRHLQFNLIIYYISDLCIAKTYVHAPNTVKRFANYEKPYLCPIECPRAYWVLPAAHLLQRFVGWLHSISQPAWKAACKAALKDSAFFPSLLWMLAAFCLALTKCLLFFHINWIWRMSVNQGRAIRQVPSKQTQCKGLFQSLILQPQKNLVQSLYWRLHSKLPWSRTVRLSLVSIVATFVCRFLSSVVKVYSASADPIEVEKCRSIKVGRLVKSLGHELHSYACFKASYCSPRSTRTGRLLRHVFTLKEERKSVSTETNSSRIDFQDLRQFACETFLNVSSIKAVPMRLDIRKSEQSFIRDGNVCKCTEISCFIVL